MAIIKIHQIKYLNGIYMLKMKSALSLTLLVSSPLYALDVESTEWTLVKDYSLTGIMDTNTDQDTMTAVLTDNEFSGQLVTSGNIIMGRFLEPNSAPENTVVNFQEVSADAITKYLGKGTGDSYQGTWFDTNGQSGDFSLGLNTSTGGGGGYLPLNIEFVPESSPGVSITGEYNQIVTSSYNWNTANTTHAIENGKWYWEVEFLAGDPSNFMAGVLNAPSVDSWASNNHAGYYYPARPNEYKPNGQSFCDSQPIGLYGPIYLDIGDVVSVMLDMDTKTISIGVNGISYGVMCEALPDIVYPAVSVYTGVQVEANFGHKEWAYSGLAEY
ncbi:SPRY domain-containing protein [Litoribrevibacter euphylliae]|uniref:SPRY domain-containing protein n=1 Tax=Litoribrevibacter euphylliae TaxID=1834034 RepID=A0ABV7HG80_9GAMM